jgi:hypothetical protein
MENWEDGNWVSLYREAILEVDQGRMPGKIEAASAAIMARVGKSGLDSGERQALEDALAGLRVLQVERAQRDADGARVPYTPKNQDRQESQD